MRFQKSVVNDPPEVAFYYPNPMWYSGDWVKSLILFFDGIALLLPAYMKNLPEMMDPAIVAGLQEHGLLHILEPESVVDEAATVKLAKAMTDIRARSQCSSTANSLRHLTLETHIATRSPHIDQNSFRFLPKA